MLTSYGIGEPLKNYKELELIYGPTTAKKIIEEKQNGKKRANKRTGRNSKKAKDNT